MNLYSLNNQLNQLHQLLKQRNTGNPKQLAKKLGISRSGWFALKAELENYFDVKIQYDKHRNSYYYAEPVEFKFGFYKATGNRQQATGNRQQATISLSYH